MNKILVTGGFGLVGYALQIISNNYKDYQFIFMKHEDCDLTNWEQTINYFLKNKPTFVIHLAANVGGLFKNMNNKVDMFEKNVLINFNVIKASHEIGVKKLINCLSTCIFPADITYPINENMLHNGPPHDSNYAYAYAKRMIEIQSQIYNEEYGDNFICIIPTNIYGPNDNYNLFNGHVIPSLIHKCFLAKMNNEKFVIAGSGKPLRQFIYSEDLAKIIMIILEKYDDKKSIIISVDEKDEITIEQVAYMIAKKYNYENIIFDETKPDGQYKKTVDNTMLKKIIGNFEFTNIVNGIKKSVEWFIENYNNCRK